MADRRRGADLVSGCQHRARPGRILPGSTRRSGETVTSWRVVAGTVFVVGSIASTGAVAGAQDDGDSVTLTVGLPQDLDSPNVTAGVLVSSYELWTLQYATLTDKAADDFATIPGLAESWEASDDGLTYTYTLREGLEWSDGEPLTAEDIAYTINRSRDEEWLNHSATVANLEATAVDDRTVEIISSVPDPKLPTMDVYIVPEHIYEEISAEDITTYDALDGVGSGPYTLEEWQPGQSWTMVANPSWYGWEDDPVDRPHRLPRVRQRRGDGRGAAGERDRRRPQPAGRVVRRARGRGRHRHRRRPAGRLHRDGDERRRRRNRRRAPGTARRRRPPRHRHGHRPPDAPRARRSRHRHRRHDDVAVGRSELAARGARGHRPRLRPRRGQGAARRGRLPRHRRRRHPGDARRQPRPDVPLRPALRVRGRAGGCPSSSPAGWRTSASPPRSRCTTTASSPRSSPPATTTCSPGAGRRSSTPTRCSRTSRATR